MGRATEILDTVDTSIGEVSIGIVSYGTQLALSELAARKMSTVAALQREGAREKMEAGEMDIDFPIEATRLLNLAGKRPGTGIIKAWPLTEEITQDNVSDLLSQEDGEKILEAGEALMGVDVGESKKPSADA